MLLTEQHIVAQPESFWIYTAWKSDGRYHASYVSKSRESISEVCETLNINWNVFKLLPEKIVQ